MPNRSKSLILCVHAHQPVGNFEHVFLAAYERSYRPFFEVLEKHPSVRMSCHFSGSLIDWIEKHKPKFFDRLRGLLARGQIEILGGAYYEPIYGVIPPRDLSGQIRMMSAKLNSLFGVEPRGGWLTERVWDNGVAKPIHQAGLEYTILDDLHFEKAGLSTPVTGYYRSGSGPAALDLFASMKEMRYLMPFCQPEETLDLIRGMSIGPSDALVFADDCEKFGFWPGMYDWVYTQGWLEKFFSLLEKSKNIGTYTFSQFRKEFKSKGSVRLVHASYSEMMEWSGGQFYNFFKRYPESRYFRDRMTALSERIHRACPPPMRWRTGSPKLRWRMSSHNGHSVKIAAAVRALYKAQCNCAYWHGVFGGLYLHHLRSAVFENLIQAEQLLSEYAGDSVQGGRQRVSSIRRELLASGPRWTVRQKKIVLYFNPRYGGALEELDFIPKSVNLTCTLMRRKESYHKTVLPTKGGSLPDRQAGAGASGGKVGRAPTGASQPLSIHQILGVKETRLEDHLFYDAFRRLSLLDHFFEHEISQADFSRSSYVEMGDFAGNAFKGVLRKMGSSKGLVLERKGTVLLRGKKRSLKVTKVVLPKKGSAFIVIYTLRNESSSSVETVWGVEFNFSIGDSYAAKGVSKKNVRDWVFNDEWRGIKIHVRFKDAEGWSLLTAPVETISESELGLERTFQGLGVLFQRTVTLKAGEAREYRLEIECS